MGLFTSAASLALLQSYGYPAIFILNIIEGPIITYVASFAASIGLFNIYTVFLLSLLANFLSDLMYFSIGRFGNKTLLHKYTSKFKHKILRKLRHHLEKNTFVSLILIKLMIPLAAAGLIVAGMHKISYKRFVSYIMISGIPFALFFSLIGFYSGIAFNNFSRYLKIGEVAILLAIILITLIALSYKRLSNLLAKKIESDL